MKPFALTRMALSAMLVAAGTCFTPPVAAEDIDIYGSQALPGSSNLLLLLDNTSNWSSNAQAWSRDSVYKKCVEAEGMEADSCTALVNSVFGGDASLKQGQVQLRALRNVLNELVCNTESSIKVNVGIAMLGQQTVRSNGDSNGFIRFAVQPLTGTATTAGSSCKRLIDNLNEIDAKITNPEFKTSSSADYSAALYEIFKYFGGYSNPTLANETPANPPAGSPVRAQGYGPLRYSVSNGVEDVNAFTDRSKTTYLSPLGTTGSCDNNIVALIGNTYPNAEPTAGPARFQGLNYTPPALINALSDTTRLADEWAYFLRNGDVSSLPGQQYVRTYTVNTYNDKEDISQTRLLKSIAAAGDGGYHVVDGDLVKLKKAFSDIISRAAAINSVFTASTLPVSTTTQGSFLNQVFIAMFRPHEQRAPRWMGNLKQYSIGRDKLDKLRLMDAKEEDALGSASGFFNSTARSFWTHSSVYFTQMPVGTPPSAADKVSDSPDGPTVEKGGVAQMLRETYLQDSKLRRVFTLPTGASNGAALSATPFSSANPDVKAAFNTSQLSWIRGENNITNLANLGYETAGSYIDPNNAVAVLGPTGARPSMHGDVLHSRPLALNYGDGDVVVYYGANDGFLRAVDGRKTGTTAGQELWSFIAPEHYPVLRRLYSNSPQLYLPATTSTGAPAVKVSKDDQTKLYGMDGPIGVFARYGSDKTIQEAIIYASMRRGGSAVYAFDVSSKTEPRLKFKISATGAYSRLAQTWSVPRPVIFPASAGAVFEDPIVLMGGGYDPAEDVNGTSRVPLFDCVPLHGRNVLFRGGDSSDGEACYQVFRGYSEGKGDVVYVINGRTGDKLAQLSTDFSVAADVSVVDTNGDGVYDRAYAADVRGNVYRINMTNSQGTLQSPSSWSIRKIASLGGKVFGAPDVVATRDFVAVMVGTGDREKPLLASTKDNFFVIKDTTLTQPDRGSVLTKSDLSLVGEVNSTYAVEPRTPDQDVSNGCYIKLSEAGEKVVNSPFTIAGVTYFGTNRPTGHDEQSCSANLGQARAYQFPLFCGLARSRVLSGGGLPPSPVGGFVSMTMGNRQELVPFIIGGGGGGGSGDGSGPVGALDPGDPGGTVSPVRKRQYYRIHNSNR